MMMDDRRNRDRLKKANEHLDHAVEALRQVVFSEIEKNEQRKIFTTKQIYDILRLRSHLAVHGHRKKLRAELRRLQKQKTPSPQEQERLWQELERLDALCHTPNVKEKIEEITAGILRKNGKWTAAYADAEKRSQELAERLHRTQRRLNAAKLWLSRENPRTLYRVIKPQTGKSTTSGATTIHSPSVMKSAATLIADEGSRTTGGAVKW